jgi:hypothetical protein
MVNALERDEPLTRTLMRAMYSLDSGVAEVSRSVANGFSAMVDSAIGADDIADREAVIETLGRVIDSAIYGWLARGDDVARVEKTLEQAVHVLLSDRSTDFVGARTPLPSGVTRRASRSPRRSTRRAST